MARLRSEESAAQQRRTDALAFDTRTGSDIGDLYRTLIGGNPWYDTSRPPATPGVGGGTAPSGAAASAAPYAPGGGGYNSVYGYEGLPSTNNMHFGQGFNSLEEEYAVLSGDAQAEQFTPAPEGGDPWAPWAVWDAAGY